MRLVLNARAPVSLNRRERIFVLSGGSAVTVFLVYLFLPAEGRSVADGPPSTVPAFHEPAPVVAPPVAADPVISSPASASGLRLHGVLGGGAAILGFPDGAQRAVPIGREFLPGLTLKAVALHHVLIATGSGDVRLEFNKPAGEAEPAVSPRTEASATPKAQRRQTLEFRTGLMPLKQDGRIQGFVIRPGANLAIFQRAGLEPGDVIVSVNGQAFRSEEKVLELSAELASARTIKIDFLRRGRRMSGKVEQVPGRVNH